MNFSEYQVFALKTAVYGIEHQVVYPTLGLASEAGEVAGKVKKYMRDGRSFTFLRDQLRDELGDVLWYIATLAHDLDLDLDEVALNNIKKLNDRKSRGVISGSGDNR
jgi:NTP pyrophosphatase (non-canonical NTP hydrolase)